MALREQEYNDNNLAICYYRYSSLAQRDVSIEQQQEAAHQYAEAHGLRIIKEYEDRALTGTNDHRPGLQNLLAEIGKLKPRAMIVWKTDRIGRNRYDLVIIKRIVRDAGCKIQYIAETIPDDSPESAIIEALYEAMAETYSKNLRTNVVRGLTYNAEHALYNGRKLLGYVGKPGEKYQIDPDTAPLVRKIYEDYAQGKPMKEIMAEINEAGHRSVLGKPFTLNSLRRILQNTTYLGEYKWGGITIPDGVPRIISDELFQKVQVRLQQNKLKGKARALELERGDNTEDFWLTGYLYCGECGGSMHGYSGRGKLGKTYYYYTCRDRIKGLCKKKNVQKALIEELVEQTMRETLSDPIQIGSIALLCEQILRQKHTETGYLEALQAQAKTNEKKIENILEAVESGHYNEALLARLNDLEARKKMLEESIKAEEARRRVDVMSMDDIARLLRQYSEDKFNTPKLRDALLNVLIEKIYLYDDRLDIFVFLGYKTIRRTVMFEARRAGVDSAENFFDRCSSASRTFPLQREKANPAEGLSAARTVPLPHYSEMLQRRVSGFFVI